MSAPLFPVFPAVASGFRRLKQDWPFLAPLIAFPVFVGFATLLILDLTPLGGSLFWAGVLKVPADFIKGIFLALYVRFILFGDTPHKLVDNHEGQKAVAASTIIFTALSLVFSGILAALAFSTYGVSAAAPPQPWVMLASGAGLVIVLWLFRYQFLPVAAAAEFPLRPFISFLGSGLALPIRILALWILAALPSVIILGFAGEVLRALGGFAELSDMRGPAAWLFYLINSGLGVATSVVQTAAAIHAIRHGMKGRIRDV